MSKIVVIAVVGPTASGKTKLGVEIAKAVGGEVVSCDSMQIYRTMDVATAKPTLEEMDGVPHHLVDILPPETPFSLAEYVRLALKRLTVFMPADMFRYWSAGPDCTLIPFCREFSSATRGKIRPTGKALLPWRLRRAEKS